ncbi:MAG: LicD family protein [Maritimibacter sp.]|nr:LicD family protein [Sedimentitalea sp.]MCB1359242.1 LicD family protein [Maritimibacter sp.]
MAKNNLRMNTTIESARTAARIDELRRRALAQIISPSDSYKGRAVLIELGELDSAPGVQTAPELLEATILAFIARGRRARRIQKQLYRLFRARVAAGELGKYEQFVQVLQYAIHDPSQLEGLYFHSAFATLDQQAIWTDIASVVQRLELVGKDVFLNSGTLLGVVRDKELIAHDDDVDLAIRLDASSAEQAVAQWKKTREKLQEAGIVPERNPKNPGTMQIKSAGVYNIDLFPAWVSEGRVYVYPHTCGDLSEDQVFPLVICETTGLKIPKDAEAMLTVNYGDGWRQPDPGYQFNWSRANRRFAAFKQGLTAAA